MTTEAISAPPPALPHSDLDRSERLPPMATAIASTATTGSTTATSTAGRHGNGKSSSASPGKNSTPSKKAATASDESQRSPDL